MLTVFSYINTSINQFQTVYKSPHSRITNNQLNASSFTSLISKIKKKQEYFNANEPLQFMMCHLVLALCDLLTYFTSLSCYFTDFSRLSNQFKHSHKMHLEKTNYGNDSTKPQINYSPLFDFFVVGVDFLCSFESALNCWNVVSYYASPPSCLSTLIFRYYMLLTFQFGNIFPLSNRENL